MFETHCNAEIPLSTLLDTDEYRSFEYFFSSSEGMWSFVVCEEQYQSGGWAKNHVFVNRMSTLFTLLTIDWIRVKKIYLAEADEKSTAWNWKEVKRVFNASTISNIRPDMSLVFETMDGENITGGDLEEIPDDYERNVIFNLADMR